jgi:hypothetical protein
MNIMQKHSRKSQKGKSGEISKTTPQLSVAQKSTAQLQDNRTQSVVFQKQEQNPTSIEKKLPVQKKENNTGLPDNLKSGIENLSGIPMNDVKVHYNSPQPAQLNAHAYAQGTDIHLASGQEKHLPHEAWHVVQQKQGRVKPTMQMKGKVNVNDDSALEKEADTMGTKALKSNSSMQLKDTIQKKTFQHNRTAEKNYGLSKIIQRVFSNLNVAAKAGQFLAAHMAERQLIIEANNLLKAYSENATAQTFNAVDQRLGAIRNAASAETNKQAALIQEYIDTADEAVRKTFLDAVLEKDSAVLKPLFNTLVNQTTLGAQVDAVYKNRFLSYVLQGMKFPAGEGRFIELMGLLGGRNIEINSMLIGPSAGLANPIAENPLGEKTNVRDKNADAVLLEQHEGNVSEFIRAKALTGDHRTANPLRGGIGNASVNMERNQTVFPIYYGHTATKDVQAFTAPMFTANHHELGHVVNKLKGKAGVHADKYDHQDGVLSNLTDEEEVHNISLDQYSDKALSGQMQLPERIAHGAFGGLNEMSPALNRGHMETDLAKWDDLTYQLTPGRKIALDLIKKIADADWSEHTKYSSKPSGVTKIMQALPAINNMGLGMKKQLEAVRRIAHTAAAEKSSNRKFATSKFYEILDQMNVDTKDGLEILKDKLDVLIDMGKF